MNGEQLSIDDALGDVIPLLVKHGLTFITAPRQTDSGYELAGILMHVSGESLEGALPIYGRQPQEIGSSVSYNRRYLLGCLTGVVTEDDQDGKASVKSSRTNTVEDVKALWTQEEVGKAPKAVQDRIKAHVDKLKAEDGA